jgi:hypothetical protein
MLMVSRIVFPLVGDVLRWWALAFRSSRSIKAENLFLPEKISSENKCRGDRDRRGGPHNSRPRRTCPLFPPGKIPPLIWSTNSVRLDRDV